MWIRLYAGMASESYAIQPYFGFIAASNRIHAVAVVGNM